MTLPASPVPDPRAAARVAPGPEPVPSPPDASAEYLVGLAVGILLVEYRSTPTRALGLLIDVATHAGRSLPDQARWVIDHHHTINTVHAAGTRRRDRPSD